MISSWMMGIVVCYGEDVGYDRDRGVGCYNIMLIVFSGVCSFVVVFSS